MPQTLTYTEAHTFAEYCYALDEFLKEYGSQKDSVFNANELLTFIENKLNIDF